jgi:chromosome segregation ATPase
MLNSIMDKVEFIEADLTELRETCDQTSQLCEDIDKGTATVIRQITALVSLVRTLATEMASSAESIRRIEERLDLVEAQSSGDGGNRNLLDTSSPGNGPTNIVSNGPIAA